MSERRNHPTIHAFLKRQTLQWSVVGFFLALMVTLPAALYIDRIATERQVAAVANAAAQAFRRQILGGQIRDAQIQMAGAFGLEGGESIVVRDAEMKVIYEPDATPAEAPCVPVSSFCWNGGWSLVRTLHPIYYDVERKESLQGYLDVGVHPTLNLSIILAMVGSLCIAFLIQALGLASAIIPRAKRVTEQTLAWAKHLKETPHHQVAAAVKAPPFAELEGLQTSVMGLHAEIAQLEMAAAKRSKAEAQLAIIREIGHDLKTPLAQLAKLVEILVLSIDTAGEPDPEIHDQIRRVLVRMNDIVKQVRGVYSKHPDGVEVAKLDREIPLFLKDLAVDPEFANSSVKIDFATASTSTARVSPTALHRVLEILARNALHAIPGGEGKIEIAASDTVDGPCLTIRDTGAGIPEEIRGRIFDFDFTTKPSRGTGLGLGIAQKLCAEVGARMSFTSEQGKGTTFQILFQPALEPQMETVQ